MRLAFLKAHPVCQACEKHRSTEIHHKAGRIGEKVNDQTDWMAICRSCHRTIHDQPALARSLGYLK